MDNANTTPKAEWKEIAWGQHLLTAGKIAVTMEGVPNAIGYKFTIFIGASQTGAVCHAKVTSLDTAKAVAVRTVRKLLTSALEVLPE